MKLQLYPWQEECLNAWYSKNCHGIANVVTGAGKTVLALSAIEQLKRNQPELRVKIVVPTTFLLSQWRSSILNFCESPSVSREEIGYCCGTRKDPADRSYMIYVINSARYTLARHILQDLERGHPVLLIADECHHYGSRENSKIFDFLPYLKQLPGRYYSLGLSATPDSLGYESVLIPGLGGEMYRYGFSDAAAGKTITPFAVFQVALSFNAEERNNYEDISDNITFVLSRLMAMCPFLKGISKTQFFGSLNRLAHEHDSKASSLANQVLNLSYKRKSLICNADSRLSCACRLIHSLSPQTKIILFGERIEQADRVYEQLSKEFPGRTGCCHSKIEKQSRSRVLERFRSGEIRILVSCRALDEGFDVPDADVGIVLSCASIERQRIQRLGRILRRQEGKDVSSLYYFYLKNTVEEPSFFTEMPEESVSCNLLYSENEGSFFFPEYEDAAVRVLEMFRQASAEKNIHKEALKCLLAGMVRADWLLGDLLGEDVWEKKISLSRTTEEKNYWVCMRQMGREMGGAEL